jgi:hypothetical protein
VAYSLWVPPNGSALSCPEDNITLKLDKIDKKTDKKTDKKIDKKTDKKIDKKLIKKLIRNCGSSKVDLQFTIG